MTETTGVPWPKVLPLALKTKKSTPFGKHKLTPYEFITRQSMPLMIEPHAHPALVNSIMTQYFKVWMQYSKAYIEQVKEAFRDPLPVENFIVPTLEPRDCVF